MVGRQLGLGLIAVLPILIVSLFLIPTGVMWSRTMPTSAGGQGKGAAHSTIGETTQDPSSGIADGSMPARPSASGPGNVTWTLCLSNGQLLAGNAACSNGPYPEGVAWDSQNGYLYVANYGSDNVSVINGATDAVVGTVRVGSGPRDVAYDIGNGYLYVTNTNSDNVSVINGARDTVVSSVTVGNIPWGVAYDIGNGYLYMANDGSNNVSVINGATDAVVGSISVGNGPIAVAYDSGNGYLYVANFGSHNVSVINGVTDAVVGSVTVGIYPYAVAYDSGNGYLYVANYGSDNMSVINGATDTVVGTIPVGTGPDGVAYDSANRYLYVTNANCPSSPCGPGNVSLINGATDTVVGNIPVGAFPVGVAYDGANGYLYVTNGGSGSISIITTGPAPQTYSVTFSESGLASGTNWSMTFGGQTLSSVTGTITFNDPNGTYSFTVGAVAGYTANITSGSLTVNGAAVSRSITFSPVTAGRYSVTFSETGLPSGTSWSVTFNGTTQSSTTASILFSNDLNGVYNFTVGGVAGYSTTPSSGSVTINGANTTQPVTFTPLQSGRYSVPFTESGLPSGTSWSVTFNGTPQSSTTTSIVFSNYLNGTYIYTVGSVPGYTANMTSGSVTISGASKIVSITFTPSTAATYAVTFSESGLPSGTTWSVTLNGATKSGTGNVAFTEPNGTYPFSVGAIAGYTAAPSSGSITVNGAAASQPITFTALPSGQYSLILSETGLPTGTNWSVTVGSTTHSSTGATISFAEVNGTYHYTVGAVTGYTVSTSSGNVTVNGASKTLTLTFSKSSSLPPGKYAVTFTESGLPSDASWSVTLNGNTLSSTTVTITFQEVNGSYTFTVGTVSGYTSSSSSGTVKVNGGPASQPVTFTSSSSNGKTNQTTGFLGLPGFEGYILVGVIVAAVAAVAGVVLMKKRSPPKPASTSTSSKEPQEEKAPEKEEAKEEPSLESERKD